MTRTRGESKFDHRSSIVMCEYFKDMFCGVRRHVSDSGQLSSLIDFLEQ